MRSPDGPGRDGGDPAAGAVDVSVLVAALDEEKYLPILLGSVRAQVTRLRTEVIVVDDGSADATAAIAAAAGARVLASREKGDVPAMRNLALAEARGAVVLFADADVAFSSDYLEQMAGPVADGRADATLCLRQAVLESRFPVLPEVHSGSYAWLLRRLPWWWFVKVPIRLLPWLAGWAGASARARRLRSPLEVPDRVCGPAIAVRRDLALAVGGYQGRFGTHEDTRFCEAVFARARRVLWRPAPVLFVSARRTFPRDARWPLRLVIAPLLELVGLGGLAERRSRTEAGYRDPAGRR